jgi:hypothetical protein
MIPGNIHPAGGWSRRRNFPESRRAIDDVAARLGNELGDSPGIWKISQKRRQLFAAGYENEFSEGGRDIREKKTSEAKRVPSPSGSRNETIDGYFRDRSRLGAAGASAKTTIFLKRSVYHGF